MKLLWNPAKTAPCVLVLGMFDGVHCGHQELLMTGDELAAKYGVDLNVYTFEPHPLERIRPDLAPPLLTTLPERSSLMASFGVTNFCVADFTPEMRDQTPEEFLQDVLDRYEPKAIVCGFNYTFGVKGSGNGEYLTAWGREHGVEIAIVPNVELRGGTVSSTRIRKLLEAGEVHEAALLMGHAYRLTGRVVHGKHVGRTLGYPTANIQPYHKKLLPAYGVYACWMETKDELWPAVVNIGRHPTVPGGVPVTVEAHALTETPLDLYGQTVRLTLLERLRPEKSFSGMEELKAQIAEDTESAWAFFNSLS